MSEKGKWFAIGFLPGAAIAALATYFAVVPGLRVRLAAVDAELDTQKTELTACKIERQALTQAVSEKLSQPAAAPAPAASPVDPKTYTLIYDTTGLTAGNSSDGLKTLGNMVRPGLGTILASLAQARSAGSAPVNGLAHAWFIPANVPVLFYGDVNAAGVLKIDGKGNVLAKGQPLSVAQVQANPKLLEVAQ